MIREDSNGIEDEYHSYLMLIVKNVTLSMFFFHFTKPSQIKLNILVKLVLISQAGILIFQHFVLHYDKDMESLELLNLNDRRIYFFA